MKRILILSIMIPLAHIAFGQNPVHDPTYSEHNYKHPNKAEYARKHHFNKSATFVPGTVVQNDNDNYKEQFKKTKPTKKIIVSTEPGKAQPRRSYKHPYGL